MPPQQKTLTNRLLRRIDEGEYALLAPALEFVELPRGFYIGRAGEEADYCYFLENGIGSVVVVSPEGQQAEGGVFGREGFGPFGLGSGVSLSTFDVIAQVAGTAHRIRVSILEELRPEVPGLARAMQLFSHVMGVQGAFTALSNSIHQVDERLARWLLMCHDRTPTDEVALTHEFLSLMLSVRRPSVTTALHVLEGNRLIKAERGHITIIDRKGLEAFAADAYGGPEAEYRRLLGAM